MSKFNWGHGLALALAAFIAFILSMIFLFSKGWNNAEMVSNHYYEEELLYQQVIDAKNNAQHLREQPIYQQDKNGIAVTFPPYINNGNTKFSYQLFRTDDEKLDVNRNITLDAQNRCVIPAEILKTGSYTLKLHWVTGKVNYQIDYDVLWK